MSARKVLKLGDPTLRNISIEVTEDEVNTKEFKKLLKDMFDTMQYENGVGLAAPQVGIFKRIVIIGESSDRYNQSIPIKSHILINPKVIKLDSPIRGFWEGCLSVPGMRGYVERPSKIQADWFDEKWNHYSEIITGFRAIVYQHECDHLDGILYVDKLKNSKMFGYTDTLDIPEDKELD